MGLRGSSGQPGARAALGYGHPRPPESGPIGCHPRAVLLRRLESRFHSSHPSRVGLSGHWCGRRCAETLAATPNSRASVGLAHAVSTAVAHSESVNEPVRHLGRVGSEHHQPNLLPRSPERGRSGRDARARTDTRPSEVTVLRLVGRGRFVHDIVAGKYPCHIPGYFLNRKSLCAVRVERLRRELRRCSAGSVRE